MKLVIELSEMLYENIKFDYLTKKREDELSKAIAKGTPLPIIEADKEVTHENNI